MPAAVLENTPQEAFGRNLANRRCSERQRSQQVASTAAGKGSEGKWRFTRCASSGPGTAKHRSGHGTARRNGKGPPDRSQPPDGTGRRNGRSGDESRFFREPPVRNGQPDAMSITMRWHSRCDGTRGAQQSITAAGRRRQVTAIAQNHPEADAASVGLVETPAPFAFGHGTWQGWSSCQSHSQALIHAIATSWSW